MAAPYPNPPFLYIYIREHVTLYFNYLYAPSSLSHLPTDPLTQEAQNPVTSMINHPGFQNHHQKQNIKPFVPPSPIMFQEANTQSNFSNLGSHKEMYL